MICAECGKPIKQGRQFWYTKYDKDKDGNTKLTYYHAICHRIVFRRGDKELGAIAT